MYPRPAQTHSCLTLVAPLSAHPLLRPTINRGLARRKGIIGKMEDRLLLLIIFIHHILWKWSSLQNLLNFLITRRIDYHSSSKYISIHSSISLKKLESGELEERLSIVRKFNSSCFLHNFCLKFPSAKSNIHRSLFSILVHLADLLWKFYTKIGLDSFNNSIDDNFLNYRSFS